MPNEGVEPEAKRWRGRCLIDRPFEPDPRLLDLALIRQVIEPHRQLVVPVGAGGKRRIDPSGQSQLLPSRKLPEAVPWKRAHQEPAVWRGRGCGRGRRLGRLSGRRRDRRWDHQRLGAFSAAGGGTGGAGLGRSGCAGGGRADSGIGAASTAPAGIVNDAGACSRRGRRLVVGGAT